MTSGRQMCPDCGAEILVAHLFGRTGKLRLDPRRVVGGAYKVWSPSINVTQMQWVCAPRPDEVWPSEREPADWDARRAADARPWYVAHECGRTAEQIAADVQRKRRARARNDGL